MRQFRHKPGHKILRHSEGRRQRHAHKLCRRGSAGHWARRDDQRQWRIQHSSGAGQENCHLVHRIQERHHKTQLKETLRGRVEARSQDAEGSGGEAQEIHQQEQSGCNADKKRDSPQGGEHEAHGAADPHKEVRQDDVRAERHKREAEELEDTQEGGFRVRQHRHDARRGQGNTAVLRQRGGLRHIQQPERQKGSDRRRKNGGGERTRRGQRGTGGVLQVHVPGHKPV